MDYSSLININYNSYIIWGLILTILVIIILIAKVIFQIKLYRTFFKMSKDIEELNNKVEGIKSIINK